MIVFEDRFCWGSGPKKTKNLISPKTIIRRFIRNDSPEEAGEPREALVMFVQSIHNRLEPFCGGQDLIAGNLRHGILSGD